ncbi:MULTISPECIES: ABC transporter six-transmembrane domain-containing protein [unclassified Leisingera]|uniref:ABC transporter six-transmembrane domain-containing protein n=1 Tax=unclassified Leisingera TaxID=2614906 RepID=UPI0003183D43|nr:MULTISPECIES: ABC transporter six-transmembrane domain-containing protein [unclassified Leisingera]KIC21377.1 integral membrane protein associated with RND-transporter [Leisingera sp. ANG-S3]KIC52084.1 integral membrane protein associated with RND-transporter [Leisingera sp. ANG-S]KID09935.1 integral membrane protein associated with RND-transporter [Leisingera sp. ANG1]
MLAGRGLTLLSLLTVFKGRIALTWALTLGEAALTALVPLFIGFAIDGLLGETPRALWHLAGLLAALVALGVTRRLYDTRAYGTIRVELGKAQAARSAALPVSALNARLDMGRELVDFLEDTLPSAMAAGVQFAVSITVLFAFAQQLALAALAAAFGMAAVYALFHRRFFRLNGQLNQQTERQVGVLEKRAQGSTLAHLRRLRRFEVQLSDAEAILYGAVFALLLALILFNLWFAAAMMTVTAGAVFSIVAYSWDFAEASLSLPVTLQTWSRLSEITARLNRAPGRAS